MLYLSKIGQVMLKCDAKRQIQHKKIDLRSLKAKECKNLQNAIRI